jgi:hypothetical protein
MTLQEVRFLFFNPNSMGIKMMKGFARFMVCALVVLLVAGRVETRWTEPQLLPPPINVNPPGGYYYAAISADGQVLCMTIDPGQYGDDDVYISERTGDSSWTVPVNAGPNVNSIQRNLSPSITSDGQKLYYVSYWAGGGYDIFVSERTGPNWDDWSPGVPLPEPINRTTEFTAQIAYDDSTLVFTSTFRPDTVPVYGDHVMYTSRLQPDGSWSEPQIIAPHLNFMNGSIHPCLTDSGRTLVYAQWIGLDMDILYAFRNDTGFGQAISCDSTINASFWDGGPSCPADGSLLYFDSACSRSTGAQKLFVAHRVQSTARQVWHPPMKYQLYQNYPNPFNPTCAIQFDLPANGPVQLKVFNTLGQLVATLVDEIRPVGAYRIIWDGRSSSGANVASGVYVYQLQAGNFVDAKKMVLIR